LDNFITANPEFFKSKNRKEAQTYFADAVAFMEKKVGNTD